MESNEGEAPVDGLADRAGLIWPFEMEGFEGDWRSQRCLKRSPSAFRRHQGQGMGELKVGALSVIETSGIIRQSPYSVRQVAQIHNTASAVVPLL